MKKILLLAFVLMTMFILVGCGGSDSGSDNIKIVKSWDTFKYDLENGSDICTVRFNIFKTNNRLYQAIDSDEIRGTKNDIYPLCVQNLLTGDIYFANLKKNGDTYDIEGELYDAFLNKMYLGYKKVYTNFVFKGYDVLSLTVEVGNATKTVTTSDGKVHTVYPVTYTWEYENNISNTATYYWAKDLGWYFPDDAFAK